MKVRSSSTRLLQSAPRILATVVLLALCAPAASAAQDQAKAAATAAPAAAPAYRAGGVPLLLPSPTQELVEVGNDNRAIMEVFAPEQNRLLAAYVLTDDAPRLRAGGQNMLSKYALVEVPRNAEFTDVTAQNFKDLTAGMDQQFGAALDSSVKEGEDTINRRLKALNLDDANVALDKPAQLGAFFSKQDAYGLGLILPVTSKGTTIKMVAGVVILRAQNRLLYAYLYTVYKDEDTVKWVRKATGDWAEAILAANKP
jgi:hypothetical protein